MKTVTIDLDTPCPICGRRGNINGGVCPECNRKHTRPRNSTYETKRNACIAYEYKHGATIRKLAADYELTFQRIKQILAAEKVTMRPRGRRAPGASHEN